MKHIYADTLGFIGSKMGPPEFRPEIFTRLRASGVRIVQWGGPHPAHREWEDIILEMASAEHSFSNNPDTFSIVRKGEDFTHIEETNLVYIIMTVQNPYLIGSKWNRLRHLRAYGARVIQLAYWDERDARYGSGFWVQHDEGLTDKGREFLQHAHEAKFVLDLSHTGPRTALEALKAYRGHVMISHTGCRAVYDHPRNATDEVIRQVASRGGIVGIFTMTFFLHATDNNAGAWLRHIQHAIEVAGKDAVVIGSDAPVTGLPDIEIARRDFPLLTASLERGRPIEPRWAPRWPAFTPEFNGVNRFRVMEDLLTRNFGATTAHHICGANALKFYREAIR